MYTTECKITLKYNYSTRVSLLNNELLQFLLTLIHAEWCFEEPKRSFLMTPKSSVCLIHTGSSPKLRGRICSFLVENYCLIFGWVGRRSSLGSQQRGTKSSLTLTCSQWYLRQGSLKTFLWKIIMCTLNAYISQEFFSPLVSYSLSFLCPSLTTSSFS